MIHPIPGQQGDTITLRFHDAVELIGDEHIDGENTARAEREATVYTFRTRVLPGALWEKLLADNKPTPAQAADGLDYHPTDWPVALIQASAIGWTVTKDGAVLEDEVGSLTVEDAVKLWDDLPQFGRRQMLGPLQAQNVSGPSLGKARSRRNGPAA